jgi:xylulokinase
MMSEVLLGIDAGTSSVKVGAFSRNGTLVAKARRPTQVMTPAPRRAEIDLEEYWRATIEAIREVADKSVRIAGIGIASTCPTLVVLDADGRPLRHAIPYLDNRAIGDLQAVGDSVGGAQEYFHLTGNRLSPSTCTAATLRWIRREEEGVWQRAGSVGFLNSFLALQLTGALAVDWTQASYSGLFRLSRPERWDGDLCEANGMPDQLLPPVMAPYERVGAVSPGAASCLGVTSGIPVAIGSADTAAAGFALGIASPGDAFESVGTSGVITFCLDEPRFDLTFMNRCHVQPGRWLAHGAMSTVGGAMAWLRNRVWPELRSLAELERLAAESAPGANGLVFLPYLAGERSPIWDAKASGAWIGLRLDSTRADMVRSVFEGSAYGLRQIVERAEREWGWRPQQLLSVGGGTLSPLWHKIKADVLGMAYAPVVVPDAAALGA